MFIKFQKGDKIFCNYHHLVRWEVNFELEFSCSTNLKYLIHCIKFMLTFQSDIVCLTETEDANFDFPEYNQKTNDKMALFWPKMRHLRWKYFFLFYRDASFSSKSIEYITLKT